MMVPTPLSQLKGERIWEGLSKPSSRYPEPEASGLTFLTLLCSTFRNLRGQGKHWPERCLDLEAPPALTSLLHPREEPVATVHQPVPAAKDSELPFQPSTLPEDPPESLLPGKHMDVKNIQLELEA